MLMLQAKILQSQYSISHEKNSVEKNRIESFT